MYDMVYKYGYITKQIPPIPCCIFSDVSQRITTEQWRKSSVLRDNPPPQLLEISAKFHNNLTYAYQVECVNVRLMNNCRNKRYYKNLYINKIKMNPTLKLDPSYATATEDPTSQNVRNVLVFITISINRGCQPSKVLILKVPTKKVNECK